MKRPLRVLLLKTLATTQYPWRSMPDGTVRYYPTGYAQALLGAAFGMTLAGGPYFHVERSSRS